MTPHYDWTPASEPPDTGRRVLVWVETPSDEAFPAIDMFAVRYGLDAGRAWTLPVTFWRDVERPEGV